MDSNYLCQTILVLWPSLKSMEQLVEDVEDKQRNIEDVIIKNMYLENIDININVDLLTIY